MSNELECRTDEPQGLTVCVTRKFLSGSHSMLFLVAAAYGLLFCARLILFYFRGGSRRGRTG